MSHNYDISHDHPSEALQDDDEETGDSENGDDGEKKTGGGTASRFITLQSLLGAGVLEPGKGAMTIDYLGQKFTGDLLLDGKIKSQETEQIYASPTAWAVSCKKIVNPAKQSGCGWATVRYKGKKLDAFKSLWLKKQYEESCLAYDFMEAFTKNMIHNERDLSEEDAASSGTPPPSEDHVDPEGVDRKQRIVVKHGVLGNRQPSHDQNILVESVTFSSLGKIQPFLISLNSNAALTIDFHCHLTTSEVVGYLGGSWDVNTHVVTVIQAFPLRCRLSDFDNAPACEEETRQSLRNAGLTLVGWYHSHPDHPAYPTLRDIDTQLDYEIRMKGNSDSSYIPCIGLICSPYNIMNVGLESQMMFYWVAPPPESRIYEYGKPMTMNYSLQQDDYIPHQVLVELNNCADFYRLAKDYVVFTDMYKSGVTYLEKLKNSITTKFPRNEETGELLWSVLDRIATSTAEKTEPDLLNDMIMVSTMTCLPSPDPEKPKLSIPSLLPVLKMPRSPTPPPQKQYRKRRSSRESKPTPSLNNYFVGSDLASALFGSAGNSLMGFDPTALSLFNLGFGGMFMPPMPHYKPDPGLGLMKPPPPPSPYYPYPSSRNSRSRSSSSSPSSSHRNSPSSSMSSAPRDMPPPNKVPKVENNLVPASLSKNCTITTSPNSTK